MTTACNQSKKVSPELWDEKELNEWYIEGDWKEEWDVQPDESIDRKEFAIQYFKYPQRWGKAFSFLKNQNLANLSPGRYELEGSELFVNVDEYVTRNEVDTRFEVHNNLPIKSGTSLVIIYLIPIRCTKIYFSTVLSEKKTEG